MKPWQPGCFITELMVVPWKKIHGTPTKLMVLHTDLIIKEMMKC